MKRLWIKLKPLFGHSLEFKHLPLTILAVLSLISLFARVVLMLR